VVHDRAHGGTDRCNIACASPKKTAYPWKEAVGERRRGPEPGEGDAVAMWMGGQAWKTIPDGCTGDDGHRYDHGGRRVQ